MRDSLRFLFRSCALCGGYPVAWGKVICPACLAEVLNGFDGAGTRHLDFAPVRFGLPWSPLLHGEKTAKLLHALKGGGERSTWETLAAEFAARQFAEIRGGGPWLIVPAPPRSNGHNTDHAGLWAQGLAKAVDGHCVSLLKRPRGPSEQKRLRRRERWETRLEAESPNTRRWVKSRIRRGWRLAFADDVVTTGATAKAAWQALGQPRSYQIWALSYRTTLRSDG